MEGGLILIDRSGNEVRNDGRIDASAAVIATAAAAGRQLTLSDNVEELGHPASAIAAAGPAAAVELGIEKD